MAEIKYYVTYGNIGTFDLGEVKKKFEEYAKAVETVGLKVVFWGAPFGVSEDAICVIKGSYENYMKLMESDINPPFTGSRTNMVMTW